MIIRLTTSVVLVLTLAGCGVVVKQSTYNEALQQNQKLQGEKDELSQKAEELQASLDKSVKEVATLTDKLRAVEKDKADTEAKLKTAEQDLEAKSAELVQMKNEIAKLKKDVEDVRIAKDKEINDIKLKVKDINARAEALLEKIRSILKEKDKE